MIIYGLSSSGSPGVIRYVGRTAGSLKARVSNHVCEARRSPKRTHKAHWIRTVLAAGYRVEGVVLAWAASDAELDRLEVHYIAKFRSLGFPLTNITNGGDGVNGLRHTDETRQKMSASHRGHASSHPPGWRHTAAARQQMSASQKGRKRSPEELEKQRLAHLGNTNSAATRLAVAEANRRRVHTDESRQKNRVATLGVKRSAETRAKLTAANLRRWARHRALAALADAPTPTEVM